MFHLRLWASLTAADQIKTFGVELSCAQLQQTISAINNEALDTPVTLQGMNDYLS
jgi:hypothetical protein